MFGKVHHVLPRSNPNFQVKMAFAGPQCCLRLRRLSLSLPRQIVVIVWRLRKLRVLRYDDGFKGEWIFTPVWHGRQAQSAFYVLLRMVSCKISDSELRNLRNDNWIRSFVKYVKFAKVSRW